MRRFLLGLSAVTVLLPFSDAMAQNYIRSRDYSGPGIVVNMDVISSNAPSPSRFPMPAPAMGGMMGTAAPMPLAPAPIMSAPLPAPVMAAPVPPVMPTGRTMTGMEAPLAPVAKPAVARVSHPISDLSSKAINSSPANVDDVMAQLVPIEKAPAAMSAPIAPASKMAIASEDLDAPSSVAPAMPSPIMSKPASASTETGMQTAMLAPPASLARPSEPLDLQGELNAAVPSAAPKAAANEFEAYRLLFDGNSDELKPSEKAVLNKIVSKMKTDDGLRLQMQSYANGTPETTAQARRMSLTRALKVRGYLMDNGISATRLDIRAMGMGSTAMGDKVSSGNAPADRVDVIFARS